MSAITSLCFLQQLSDGSDVRLRFLVPHLGPSAVFFHLGACRRRTPTAGTNPGVGVAKVSNQMRRSAPSRSEQAARQSPSACSDVTMGKKDPSWKKGAVARSQMLELEAKLVEQVPPVGYMGHNYMGHNYMGYNYIGHNYRP